MEEHPDIEELLKENLSSEVTDHLKECDLCSLIKEDAQLLDLELSDLTKPVDIPDSKEREINREISMRSRQIRQRIFRKNLLTSAVAIAAVLVISLIMFGKSQKIDLKTADINGDGEVNVLDSFMLARKIADNSASGIGDMDANGVTDEEDLKRVRFAVVNIERRQP